ncbi:Frequency clock protein [Lachnellula suecica]|uniref:Frequency clock protein n=1 Tax=Lachnellula suecica TaxID=602035 RepID=A0A8T9C1D8_9HELO|nr:Frequency clock protein [Lachnellula suecica]
MNTSFPSTASHPRRVPAHASVSLRHSRPACHTDPKDSQLVQNDSQAIFFPTAATAGSDESNPSAEAAGMTVEKWFDHSNKRPTVGVKPIFEDNEPPYFLPHHSSAESSKENLQDYNNTPHMLFRSGTNGSNSEDFRSVIDDLTIENRKLKEKLRKYERTRNPSLEKDKLFEVKYGALPSKGRRELEELLHTFASSFNGSETRTSSKSKGASKGSGHKHPSLLGSATGSTQINASNSSTSISRPVDSAYASMSTSGPGSSSEPNHRGFPKAEPQAKFTQEQNIQNFLHDIPEGLLPKHAAVMTERQKKKLVVRRLEQLFTGKVNGTVGDHKQPLQQQEVSNSAAKADLEIRNPRPLFEGVREAHILPQSMDVDKSAPPGLANATTYGTTTSEDISKPAGNNAPGSPEQRPTRPLDLDPDRAQIPSDNVEYIRHLGLSTPQLITGDSGDAESDAQGWIYLNLLIGLAQLHIINVTPDFVRSAVEDVSSKFQLSRDGRKIRWRGGTEGSRFSSESDGNSSARTHSLHDSDSLDEESGSKRRKLNNPNNHMGSQGRFASIPHEPSTSKLAPVLGNPFYYKPLFNHRNSEDSLTSLDNEDVSKSNTPGGASGMGRDPMSGSESSSRKIRREDGPMVFYSGAKFCTDLSGDRGNICTPLHDTGVGLDGYSDRTLNVLGCASRKGAGALSRTQSGSLMQFRPFKSQFGKSAEGSPTKSCSSDNESVLYIEPGVECSSRNSSPRAPLMAFDASGLGGTQPADHFAVTVKTRRTKLENVAHPKLSKFSAPGQHSRRFQHSIPKASLDLFQVIEHEDLASSLATLKARTPSPNPQASKEACPVKTEVIATSVHQLEPSELPAPTAYFASFSGSESSSEYDSGTSYSGISHLRQPRSPPFIPGAGMPSPVPWGIENEDADGYEKDDEDEDVDEDMSDIEDGDDSDDSIDMLAAAREADPETVRAREMEFELQAAHRVLEELPAGSSAATVDGGSGFSSLSAETSGDE